MVTWANWHYQDFVRNWVDHVREANITSFLVIAARRVSFVHSRERPHTNPVATLQQLFSQSCIHDNAADAV